ncbi:MAG: RNA-binding cell elongation regulator Jag/EloR [Bacillota bacterium]
MSMRSMEFSGKSIDEAIFVGLQQMEIAIDEVDIEIIQNETKGVFGIGSKPAIVRLTEKPPESILHETQILAAEPDGRAEASGQRESRQRDSRPQRPQRESREVREPREARDPREARPVQPQTQREIREGKGQRENRLAREAAQHNASSGQREREPGARERDSGAQRQRGQFNHDASQQAPKIEYSGELAKNNNAAIFLSGLLERMGVEAAVLAAQQEGALRLRIDSTSMGVLIGHRGETLDAMQYLTSLVLNRNHKDESYTRVTLDTEDYRDKREETLRRLARKLASQVKASGKPLSLEPMNPYERRVLHASLQSNPYVTTHSEGEEPNRHVVIAPKK